MHRLTTTTTTTNIILGTLLVSYHLFCSNIVHAGFSPRINTIQNPTTTTFTKSFPNSNAPIPTTATRLLSRFPLHTTSTSTPRTVTRLFGSRLPPFLPSRQTFLRTAGGLILLTPFLGEAYARSFPTPTTDVSSVILPSNNFPTKRRDGGRTETVPTIVFHGAGGPDSYTEELLNALCDRVGSDGAVMVNWTKDSMDTLRGSNRGIRIGRMLADRFLTESTNSNQEGEGTNGLRKVHVIGISVGAFPANAFAQQIKTNGGSKVEVQLTLLDPFSQKGVLGIGYGNRRFGKDLDYAQQFMNTDDPVPSTNSPLRNCATTDVTPLRPSEIWGHDWPLVYYARRLASTYGTASEMPTFVPDTERREIGTVEVL